ncbi:MAG: prepilin-type N-terminal cleavage/methylation domain-containing protein [Candidatus Eremiobacteraeota bacterium]|nr:prepilin-type N-terminal cleavage/methylation domain-containing protein [Candidatus Eremiobacteraeota bacterium]MCW5870736.1 prepilin-type N-terminal cleavage/methylation domain-containing protein [Candidatus Eremiobacteraeota bacterium]
MTPSSANRSRSGFTLAEVVVSLALTSLLLVSLAQLLNSCQKYLNQTTMTTELQQSCVIATSRLVTELLESNGVAIRGDTNNHKFVTFGSARNQAGQVTFAASGDLQWHSYIGYYVAPDGEEMTLYRKEKWLDTPVSSPPTIPNDYHDAFWTNLNASRGTVAKRVYYLDVVSSTTVDVILGAKSRDNQFLVSIKTKLKARN